MKDFNLFMFKVIPEGEAVRHVREAWVHYPTVAPDSTFLLVQGSWEAVVMAQGTGFSLNTGDLDCVAVSCLLPQPSSGG